jgi:hypothetical protein
LNLDDEYIFIHKAECRGYNVENTRGYGCGGNCI